MYFTNTPALNSMEAIMKKLPYGTQKGGGRFRRLYQYTKKDCDCRLCLYYLFLTNMTAIEYIRNAMKRVRKKESSIILASQNIEDFLIPSIREFTKPLFSIPTHQFLFNAGQINPKEYMDALQVEPAEFELIKYPERGTCLYRCGNERYLLQVIAPDYKSALFGKAGGR